MAGGNSQPPEFPALNDTPTRQFHHEYHQKIFLQSSLVAIGSVVSQHDLSCKGEKLSRLCYGLKKGTQPTTKTLVMYTGYIFFSA